MKLNPLIIHSQKETDLKNYYQYIQEYNDDFFNILNPNKIIPLKMKKFKEMFGYEIINKR